MSSGAVTAMLAEVAKESIKEMTTIFLNAHMTGDREAEGRFRHGLEKLQLALAEAAVILEEDLKT
jgi:hypothetical protein